MADKDNFLNFSSIQIGTHPVNTFSGLFIYSAALSVNPGGPTKLVVRAVQGQINETTTRARTSFPSAIAADSTNVSTNIYTVLLGPLRIPEMYLVTKESSVTSGQRTMTLTFSDKSILLDKIFVGLIGQHSSYNDLPLSARLDGVDKSIGYKDLTALFAMQHVQSTSLSAGAGRMFNMPTDPLPPAGLPIRTRALRIPLVLNCEPCYDAVNASPLGALIGMRTVPNPAQPIAPTVLRLIDYGRIVAVNHFFGGKIILGVDQFTSKNTDLPETDYNFTELLTALAEAGLLPLDLTPNRAIWRGLGWIDKNPDYRVKHVGTLRQVLDNFSAEFGFTYFWDFAYTSYSRVALRAVDLTNTSAIDLIINEVKDLVYDPPDGVGFDNIDESESMEGTKQTWFQGYYRKPAKPKAYQRRIQYRQIYQSLDPYDLFPSSVNGGRSRNEFAKSCAFAKFNKFARTIYNFNYATPLDTAGVIGNQTNFEHLGLTLIDTIKPSEMETMINDDFSVTAFDKTFENYNRNNDAYGLLCVYSKTMEQKWETWEAQVADMYGKYYITEDTDTYANFCGFAEKWEKDVQIAPAGTKIMEGNLSNLPFLPLLESHPDGRSIMGTISGNFWRTVNHSRSFNIFGKNAPWGTDQGQFDSCFIHSGVDFLTAMVPMFIPVKGAIKLRFFDRIKDVLPGGQASQIIGRVNQRDNDAMVILCLRPDAQQTKENFKIELDALPPHRYDHHTRPSNSVTMYRQDADADLLNQWGNSTRAPQGQFWNNPNEYSEPDPRSRHKKCEETFFEMDYVKDACECPSVLGYLPTGDQTLVPIRTEREDEQLTDILAPRAGLDFKPYTLPWIDWGGRIHDKTIITTRTFAQANAAYPPEITKVKREDIYRPFIKDFRQQENQGRYGKNTWYLADTPPVAGGDSSWESRHHIHHCRGFRLTTKLPGVLANNTLPLNTIVYHPTGSGFKGPSTNVDVIFPSENWYLGVKNEAVSYTKTMPGARQVRGGIGTAGNGMSIDINSIDMTQDFDSISDPGGAGVINMMVPIDPTIMPGSLNWGLKQLVGLDALDQYWLRIGAYSNTSIALPQRTLSFRQFGTHPVLIKYTTPQAGLTNMTITLDQDGSFVDYSFATRPAQLPNVDAMKIKIGPMLNMNMIR